LTRPTQPPTLHGRQCRCGVCVQNVVRRLTLRIDRLFPQHFTNYTVRARNSEGVAVMHFQLARGTLHSLYSLHRPPPRTAISLSVCLYVCLSAGISKTTCPHLPHFLYVFPVAVARSSCGSNMLCASGFVRGVMFCVMERMDQNQRRCVSFVQFARWRHCRRSLPSSTAS